MSQPCVWQGRDVWTSSLVPSYLRAVRLLKTAHSLCHCHCARWGGRRLPRRGTPCSYCTCLFGFQCLATATDPLENRVVQIRLGVSKRNWLMRTSRVLFKRNSLTLFFKSCGCRLASLRFGFEIDTIPAIFQASVVKYALAKYSQSLRA